MNYDYDLSLHEIRYYADEILHGSASENIIKQFNEHIQYILSAKRRDIKHLYRLYEVLDYFDVEIYHIAFGKDFWWHLDNGIFCILRNDNINYKVFIAVSTEEYPTFNNIIEEVEYTRKLALAKAYDFPVNMEWSISKIFVELIKANKLSVNDVLEFYKFSDNKISNLSISYAGFVIEHYKTFGNNEHTHKLYKYLRIPENIYIDLEKYITAIKNMTKHDLSDHFGNGMYYYLIKNPDDKLTAIKIFVKSCKEAMQLDNSDNIIIPKSLVSALYGMPGFDEFIES